jgi:hypothetical protein
VAPWVAEAELSQPAGGRNQVACLRVLHQRPLQSLELVVVQIIGAVTLEGRQLDEDGFHSAISIRKLRIESIQCKHREKNHEVAGFLREPVMLCGAL